MILLFPHFVQIFIHDAPKAIRFQLQSVIYSWPFIFRKTWVKEAEIALHSK